MLLVAAGRSGLSLVPSFLLRLRQNNVQRGPKKCRNKILKNPKFWIVLTFVLAILVTIISLILYSNIYTDQDEQNLTNFSSDSTCSYTGFVNLTNPCLWHSWIKNETLFQERITSVYSMSPFLKYFFIAARVNYTTVEDKSAVIHLDFTRPSKSMKYLISTELVEGILRQDMYNLEKSTCQGTHILKDSLKVTVMSM
ncbi:TPA-induced transmembrane protein [Bufo gargarizans]|uniref:TPA-induced transmembrane protein n=1 Tax=Bufo gargarizans TaxID=30331 RepID=UPI001CF3B987|nr:TPA-induced transmembrane protein [Bufo gargarizans]